MIKNKLTQRAFFILAAFLLMGQSVWGQTLSGTYTLPGTINGNTVNNLTQLSNLLNSATVSGTVIFEFTSSYTTTGESYPIIFTAFSGTGNVIIRPAASVGSPLITSGSPASLALVSLSGIKNLTFDGRAGGAGTAIEWQFENTASGGSYPAFQLINGAQYDALKYLTVEGSGTNTTGTINLSTSTTTGNSYDTIGYCNITGYSGYPYIQIYSAGSTSYLNSNNSILNNNISNFQAYNGNFAPTQGGIIITSTGNGSNWNISGNSIYCTGAPNVYSAPIGAISFNPGSASTNNVISGNYIGGQQPLCGGGAMKIVSNEANGYPDFDGIYSGGGSVTISNNTIQNIFMGSKYGSSTFCGINIAGAGTATVSNNTIGSATDTNNIVSGLNGTMLGIWNQNSGTVTINANTIANLTTNYSAYVSGTSSQTPGAITGIYDYGGGNGNPNIGATTVTNNQVFNLSCASNYNNNLYFYINSGSGIFGGAQDNSYNNVLCGIYMEQDNTSNNAQIISKNTVYGLNSTVTGGTDISYINGIVALGNTGGTNIINGNLVYGMYAPNTYGSSGTYYIGLNGIYLPTNHLSGKYFVQDNIVDLGYRSTDASSVTNAQIFGIWENNSDANNTNLKEYIYHNSVYIGGSDNTSLNSYAFARDLDYGSTVYDSMTIMNNIFVNNRTTTGSAYEYGMYLNSTIDVIDDYNDIYGTGSSFYYGAANGSNYNTKAAFQVGNPGYETHSISANPQYVSPTTATPNLHITNVPSTSPIDQAGTASYTIIYDFDSLIRANFSPVDLGATIDCSNSSPASVTLASSLDTICPGTLVTFTATPTNGGTPVYDFYLDGVSVQNGSSNTYTNSSLNNNDSVKVKITGNSPCASVDTAFSNSISITVNSSGVVPAVGLNPSQTSICAGAQVIFTATPTNGGSAPVYKFYKNGVLEQNSSSNSYAGSALNNNDSVWVVLYSNAACASPDSAKSTAVVITVTASVTPTVSVSPSLDSVCAGTSITFTATYTNGGAAPVFDFYVNGTSVQNSAVATYSSSAINNHDSVWVVITSNATCASPASVTSSKVHMAISAGLTVNVNPTDVTCYGDANGTITATATGGLPAYRYELNSQGYQFSSTFDSLAPGNYTVHVMDTAGCTATYSSTVVITQPDTLTASVTTTNATTDGGSNGTATGTSSGGTSPYSYHWSTLLPLNALPAGTYCLTVTDSHGCTATACGIVSQPGCNGFTATDTVTNVLCYGGNTASIKVAATGGHSPYQYSLNSGSYQSLPDFAALNSGIYSIVVKDSVGCLDTISAIHVTQPAALNVSVITTATGNGTDTGTAIAHVTGGTTPYASYLWNNSSLGDTIVNLGVATYCVTVTDAHGCTASACGAVTQPNCSGLSVSHVAIKPIQCYGADNGKIVVTGSGGTAPYQYELNSGAYQLPDSFSNLGPGTYVVTIRDDSGCTFVDTSIGVQQPAALVINVNTTPVSSAGASDGSAIAVVTGGTGPDSLYIWNTGANTDTITNLATSTYCVTVMDHNGCTASACGNVNAPGCSGFVIDSVVSVNATCYDDTNGLIHIYSSGGTSPINYSINNGATYQTNSLFNNLAASLYSVQAKDAASCVAAYANNPVDITQPPALTPAVSLSGQTVSTDIYVTYQWYLNGAEITGAHGQSYTATQTGLYNVVVTDSAGCTGTSGSIHVTVSGIGTLASNSYAVSIFPNPTSGELNIRLDGFTAGVLRVRLYDLQGQVISSSNITSSTNNTFALNIGNFSAGLYYLQLQANDWSEMRKVEVVK